MSSEHMLVFLLNDTHLDEMVKIWNENSDLLTSSNKIVTVEGLKGWREHSDMLFYGIGDRDETVYGFATVKENPEYVYLEQIAINEKYRGKNLASQLVEVCKNFEKDVKTNVIQTNIDALNFFVSLGFRFIEKDEDGYLMELKVEDF